jgi:hexulose-6-phosphate isomerase
MNPLPRRRFLGVAASVAAVAALDPKRLFANPSPPRQAKKRTLKKAVGLGMVGEGATVLEKFQLLRDLGFDGVEIDRPDATPLAEFKAAQEKSGLKVHGVVDSVHWSQPLNSPDGAVRAKGVEGLKAALKEVLPIAQRLKVKIAIENVWNNFLLSPLEAARYVDELDSEWAGFHFDIGNVVTYGWPEQWIRLLGPRIVKLHVKDYSRKKRDEQGRWKGFEVELGEGDAGYPAVMKALDETGYSTAPAGNWATAEVNGGDRKRLKQVAEQMDRLFAM